MKGWFQEPQPILFLNWRDHTAQWFRMHTLDLDCSATSYVTLGKLSPLNASVSSSVKWR